MDASMKNLGATLSSQEFSLQIPADFWCFCTSPQFPFNICFSWSRFCCYFRVLAFCHISGFTYAPSCVKLSIFSSKIFWYLICQFSLISESITEITAVIIAWLPIRIYNCFSKQMWRHWLSCCKWILHSIPIIILITMVQWLLNFAYRSGVQLLVWAFSLINMFTSLKEAN